MSFKWVSEWLMVTMEFVSWPKFDPMFPGANNSLFQSTKEDDKHKFISVWCLKNKAFPYRNILKSVIEDIEEFFCLKNKPFNAWIRELCPVDWKINFFFSPCGDTTTDDNISQNSFTQVSLARNWQQDFSLHKYLDRWSVCHTSSKD